MRAWLYAVASGALGAVALVGACNLDTTGTFVPLDAAADQASPPDGGSEGAVDAAPDRAEEAAAPDCGASGIVCGSGCVRSCQDCAPLGLTNQCCGRPVARCEASKLGVPTVAGRD